MARPTFLPRLSIRELRAALRGEEARISSRWAAYALSKTRAGVDILSKLIRSSDRSPARLAAIYGFTSVKRLKVRDFETLLRILKDPSEDPVSRGQAAEALGPHVDYRRARQRKGRDRQATEAFLRGLNDPAPEVRLWSIFALAVPGNDWVIPHLEPLTYDSALVPKMYSVGHEARWAIKWIRGEDPDLDPPSA
jgi:hypothetical protein